MSVSESSRKEDKISKDDWLRNMESSHIYRNDMNKLIMNYLITGL